MIHLRLPVESSAIPAAWPCAVARPKTKPRLRGNEHSPFGRHSSTPRSASSPTIAVSFARRTNWVRICDTANSPQAHPLGTDSRGARKTRTATLQWLAQPLGSWGLIPHSAVHRKSVCRKSDIRSRAVGAYLRTDRRHTVQLVRVASAPRLNCGVGCKEPIPSSFNKTGSTKAATSRRGNSREIFAAGQRSSRCVIA